MLASSYTLFESSLQALAEGHLDPYMGAQPTFVTFSPRSLALLYCRALSLQNL